MSNGEDLEDRASPLAAARTVLWSFLGVRRGSDHDAAAARLTPMRILIAGAFGAAMFVLLLVSLVRLVVAGAS